LGKSLPRMLRKWGTMKTEAELRKEYSLDAFLNVQLSDKEFDMKTLHTKSLPSRLIHRVRNPSAVGSKHNRKLSKLPLGVIVPQDVRSRTLDEEISSALRNLYIFLGIAEATPLPLMEKENLPDESLGKDEITVDNSMFQEYLRRVQT